MRWVNIKIKMNLKNKVINFHCLLFIKALKININMLIFKTTLNKDPVIVEFYLIQKRVQKSTS